MPLILKTKQDRQLWCFMTPNQRESAKNGQCINLTADFIPEDIPTRFVFVCLDTILWEFIDKQEDEDYYFNSPIKVFFEDGVFKASKQLKPYGVSIRFDLPWVISRSRFYKSLPTKYQKLILSKVDKTIPGEVEINVGYKRK